MFRIQQAEERNTHIGFDQYHEPANELPRETRTTLASGSVHTSRASCTRRDGLLMDGCPHWPICRAESPIVRRCIRTSMRAQLRQDAIHPGYAGCSTFPGSLCDLDNPCSMGHPSNWPRTWRKLRSPTAPPVSFLPQTMRLRLNCLHPKSLPQRGNSLLPNARVDS